MRMSFAPLAAAMVLASACSFDSTGVGPRRGGQDGAITPSLDLPRDAPRQPERDAGLMLERTIMPSLDASTLDVVDTPDQGSTNDVPVANDLPVPTDGAGEDRPPVAMDVVRVCDAGVGVVLSSGKPATASSVYRDNDPGLAFDQKGDTSWETDADAQDEFLEVDLGSVQAVARVEIDWNFDYAITYQIELSSDGMTFTSVVMRTGGVGGMEGLNLPAGSQARYVRMHATSAATDQGFGIFEMRVFGRAVCP